MMLSIFGIIAALALVYALSMKGGKKEGFVGNVPLRAVASKSQVFVPNSADEQVKNLTFSGFDNKIVSNANYQALPTPRAGIPQGIKASLNYRPAGEAQMAFRTQSAFADNMGGKTSYSNTPSIEKFEAKASDFADLVKPAVCGSSQGSAMMSMLNASAKENDTVLLPNDTVSQGMDAVTADGVAGKVYVYDRLMYSTAKGRYFRNASDYIRGDLPVVPCHQTFSTYGNPATDLNRGSTATLVGWDNRTAKEAAALAGIASNNTMSTFSGTSLDREQKVALSALAGDVGVITKPAAVSSYRAVANTQPTAFP